MTSFLRQYKLLPSRQLQVLMVPVACSNQTTTACKSSLSQMLSGITVSPPQKLIQDLKQRIRSQICSKPVKIMILFKRRISLKTHLLSVFNPLKILIINFLFCVINRQEKQLLISPFRQTLNVAQLVLFWYGLKVLKFYMSTKIFDFMGY